MKRIRSEDEIYNVLFKALSEADTPLTAPELMDIPEVREIATERFGNDIQTTTNKVSDTLGFMWRRDVLKRYTAPESPHYRARYSYSAPPPQAPSPPNEVPRPPSPSTSTKPRVSITESEGKVVIDYENITIIIKSK